MPIATSIMGPRDIPDVSVQVNVDVDVDLDSASSFSPLLDGPEPPSLRGGVERRGARLERRRRPAPAAADGRCGPVAALAALVRHRERDDPRSPRPLRGTRPGSAVDARLARAGPAAHRRRGTAHHRWTASPVRWSSWPPDPPPPDTPTAARRRSPTSWFRQRALQSRWGAPAASRTAAASGAVRGSLVRRSFPAGSPAWWSHVAQGLVSPLGRRLAAGPPTAALSRRGRPDRERHCPARLPSQRAARTEPARFFIVVLSLLRAAIELLRESSFGAGVANEPAVSPPRGGLPSLPSCDSAVLSARWTAPPSVS